MSEMVTIPADYVAIPRCEYDTLQERINNYNNNSIKYNDQRKQIVDMVSYEVMDRIKSKLDVSFSRVDATKVIDILGLDFTAIVDMVKEKMESEVEELWQKK